MAKNITGRTSPLAREVKGFVGTMLRSVWTSEGCVVCIALPSPFPRLTPVPTRKRLPMKRPKKTAKADVSR